MTANVSSSTRSLIISSCTETFDEARLCFEKADQVAAADIALSAAAPADRSNNTATST